MADSQPVPRNRVTYKRIRTVNRHVTQLLNEVGVKSYKQLNREFFNDQATKAEMNQFLVDMHNTAVDAVRENQPRKVRVRKFDGNAAFKRHFNNLADIASTKSKPSKEERFKRRVEQSTPTLSVADNTNQLPNNLSRAIRRDMKALNGVFHTIHFDFRSSGQRVHFEVARELITNELIKLLEAKPRGRYLHVSLLSSVEKRQVLERNNKNKIVRKGETANEFWFNGKHAETLITKQQIRGVVNQYITDLQNDLEQPRETSDSTFERFREIFINASYSNIPKVGSFIPTPEHLQYKKCFVNIKNMDDDLCLVWSILAHFHYEHIRDKNIRNTPKPYMKWVTYDEKEDLHKGDPLNRKIYIPSNIVFPCDIDRDIPRIEKANDIKINVFVHENGEPRCVYLTNEKDFDDENIINLLLVEKDDKKHFILIRNYCAFRRHGDYDGKKRYYCNRCMRFSCAEKEDYVNHVRFCRLYEPVRCELSKERYMQFKNFSKMFPHQFSVKADFEATQSKEGNERLAGSFQKHLPNSYALYYDVYDLPEESEQIEFAHGDSETVMKQFIQDVERLAKKSYALMNRFPTFNKNQLTPAQWKQIDNATNCTCCDSKFSCEEDTAQIKDAEELKKHRNRLPVIHHCHLTGKFLSVVCSQCNFQLCNRRMLPIVFHNLKGYDGHLVINAIAKYRTRFEMEGQGVEVEDKTNMKGEDYANELKRYMPSKPKKAMTAMAKKSFDSQIEALKELIDKAENEDARENFQYQLDVLEYEFANMYTGEIVEEEKEEDVEDEEEDEDDEDKVVIQSVKSSRGLKVDKIVYAIPTNEEKYISFSFKTPVEKIFKQKNGKQELVKEKDMTVTFLDSLAFMPASLGELVENLKDGCETLGDLRRAFPTMSKYYTNDRQFLLMLQKGVYPYDWFDTYDKMSSTCLPPKSEFTSHLSGQISDKEHLHARNVWVGLNCNSFFDYHMHYLRCDVLLLTDVWNSFRTFCMQTYGLECHCYYTLPGLSWDAMLLYNHKEYKELGGEFKIELFHKKQVPKTDKDGEPKPKNENIESLTELGFNSQQMEICLMFESSIRGGLSQICHRYAKANNKYVPGYDPSKPDEHICYFDANNLYGHSMQAPLPIGGYAFDKSEWTTERILSLHDNAPVGYLFEVALTIPHDLHDVLNQYPPLPTNRTVENYELNTFQYDFGADGFRKPGKVGKLISDLNDKDHYILNYRLLKFALNLGFKLTRVYRVVRFEQVPFLAGYINSNNERRKKAKNAFEKNFFKLCNNSVFGKCMESVRKRIDFVLYDNDAHALRAVNIRKHFTIFNENLVGCHRLKQCVRLNKPLSVGQTILDESKLHMYKFHYNFIVPTVGRENFDLLMTDTDSLVYRFKTFDPYQMMLNNPDEFDMSEFPKSSPFYNDTNAKVLGKFKIEECSHSIPVECDEFDIPDNINSSYVIPKKPKPMVVENYATEFVGLRSKMYAMKTCYKDLRKCKGVKGMVVKKNLTFDLYKRILENPNPSYVKEHGMITQYGLRTHKHEIYTVETEKIGLSAIDDKMFIKDDLISCYSLGHYKIKEMKC